VPLILYIAHLSLLSASSMFPPPCVVKIFQPFLFPDFSEPRPRNQAVNGCSSESYHRHLSVAIIHS
jgi:hypothetical protein